MQKKHKKQNMFVELINFIVSFFISIIKSIGILFGFKPKKETMFFKGLDFTFYSWPKFFWKKPTTTKAGRFLGDFINYIFYKK